MKNKKIQNVHIFTETPGKSHEPALGSNECFCEPVPELIGAVRLWVHQGPKDIPGQIQFGREVNLLRAKLKEKQSLK